MKHKPMTSTTMMYRVLKTLPSGMLAGIARRACLNPYEMHRLDIEHALCKLPDQRWLVGEVAFSVTRLLQHEIKKEPAGEGGRSPSRVMGSEQDQA